MFCISMQKIDYSFKLPAVVLFLILTALTSQAARVDNITQLVFFTVDEVPYAAFQETLYKPTTQTYSKGSMASTGFNESRLSVYNLSNGRLIAQKHMGRIDSAEAFLLLGYSPGHLWIYSTHFKSGLQSLHPLTLEKNLSQANIYARLSQAIGRFAEPDWHELADYYAYSRVQQKLIVTNQDGERFYIDPDNFCPEKISETLVLNPEYSDFLKSSASLNDKTWSLKGYDGLKLSDSDEADYGLSFTHGKFIMEQNPRRLLKYQLSRQETLMEQLAEWEARSASEKQSQQVSRLKNELEEAKNEIQVLLTGKKPASKLLQASPESFFIYSRNDDSPESLIRISKVRIKNSGKPELLWETAVTEMFYNVATARNSRMFKHYFGDFSPEFNFHHFELVDKHLIVIYLMQVCAIDTQTGAVEWSFVLK
ncbi:MAG: hypothetical protein AB7S69_17675 [Salinivirgaceae bacterium]